MKHCFKPNLINMIKLFKIIPFLFILSIGLAHASGEFEGMNEVSIVANPPVYENLVKNLIPNSISVVSNSPNRIVVTIIIGKGGIINGDRIEYGLASLQVFRDADVYIENRNRGITAKTRPMSVRVWNDGIPIYNDMGDGSISRDAPMWIKKLFARAEM